MAWVGCWCLPSPALMTMASVFSVIFWGVPARRARQTNMSTFMASMVWMVSARLSPFTTEEVEPPMEILSAERRFSASSKELLVRVDGSRKRFTMVRPRSAGTFLMVRALFTASRARAVSRICVMSSAVRLYVSMRCLTESIYFSPPSPMAADTSQISTESRSSRGLTHTRTSSS